MVGGLSPFIEESVTLNGRLEPSKTNWIKIQDTAMVLDERPDKVCVYLFLAPSELYKSKCRSVGNI